MFTNKFLNIQSEMCIFISYYYNFKIIYSIIPIFNFLFLLIMSILNLLKIIVIIKLNCIHSPNLIKIYYLYYECEFVKILVLFIFIYPFNLVYNKNHEYLIIYYYYVLNFN